MNKAEKHILENQFQIMWTLHYLLKCAKPDLVGRGGEIDRFLDDLVDASKSTRKLTEHVCNTQDGQACPICGRVGNGQG